MISTNKKTIVRHEAPLADLFTSKFIKSVVLFLIVGFNMVVLRNSFMLLSPKLAFSGSMQLDAFLYGVSMAFLMVIILFHEEQWENVFCPGAIVLYFNVMLLILYMNWFGWLIGKAITLWLMGGVLIFIPVLGLFVMVAMLKR